MSDLGARLKTLYPDLLSLQVEPVETGIVLGGIDETPKIYVLQEQDGWVIQTIEAHEHVESAEEGLALAAALVRGEVHTCQEFRGEKLAASWFEYPIEGGLETGGVAAYLNPFDRDEWRLWQGETWRRVRTTRSLDSDKLAASTFELSLGESIHLRSTFLVKLNEGLGEPATGMKWRSDAKGKFVLQIPTGWRSARTHEGAEDFEPERGALIIRTSVFYRNAESAHRELLGSAARPLSTDYEVLQGTEEWTHERWTLMFGDGDQDVMVWVDLYADRKERTAPNLIREQINGTLGRALYIPLDWDFSTIAN